MGTTNSILRYIGGTAGPAGDGWVPVLDGDDYVHLTTTSPQTVASDFTVGGDLDVTGGLDVGGSLLAGSGLAVDAASDAVPSVTLMDRSATAGGQILFEGIDGGTDWQIDFSKTLGITNTLTIGEVGSFWPSLVLQQNSVLINGPTRMTSVNTMEPLRVVAGSFGNDAVNIGFYPREANKTTRTAQLGYVGAGSTTFEINNEIAGDFVVKTNNTERFRIESGGATSMTGWASGPAISVGAVDTVIPVRVAGLSGTGYVGYYPNATSLDSMGTREGYVGVVSGNMTVAAEGSQYIIFRQGGSESARFTTSSLLLAKTDGTVDGAPGQVFWTAAGVAGARYATRPISDSGYLDYLGRTGTAAAGVGFMAFYLGASIVGRIQSASASTVSYLTNSDATLKGNVQDIDDDDAIATVEAWRPVSFQWRQDGNGAVSALAEPRGQFEHGFLAQEMYEVTPQAVAPGRGSHDDHIAWLESRAQDPDNTPEDSPWTPWGGDWSKLVPDLAAAVRALIRKNRDLTDRVAALEGALGIG